MSDLVPPHPEPAGAPPFEEVVASSLSRRQVVAGGTAALAAFLGLGTPTTARAATARTATAAPAPAGPEPKGLLGFAAVPPATTDAVTVPPGYSVRTLAPWGRPLHSGGPAWLADAGNSSADQARQIGSHHSGVHFFPYDDGPRGNRLGTLVVNHEATDATLLHRDGGAALTREKVDKSLAAQGLSVVEVREKGGTWDLGDSPRNVRVTGTTPVDFSGPLGSGHPALHTGTAHAGTLGNSSYGVTPWGTYLSCEENVAGYFGTEDSNWRPTRTQKRYGVSASGHGHRWHTVAPRFDLAANPNEVHRFGWVVEVDPAAPSAPPVKRTALGRFQHVGATVTEAAGRVVLYSGDDENGGYLYKFVGADEWRRERARGRSPLDHGTLYVARFEDDGTGRWLPLTHGRGPLKPEHGWRDQADVVLRVREAADALGATPLDRPQQTAIAGDGTVYCALANSPGGGSCGAGGDGSGRAVSPRASNPYGHIVRWREEGAEGFRWDVFVLAGDPAHDESVELDEAGIFGSPKGLWFDGGGRLWIQTGISKWAQNCDASGHGNLGNNAVLVADPATGEIRRFLTGPRGAEITGVTATPDGRTLFVNIQHPGERTAAWGAPTPDAPCAVSDWPDRDPKGRPRSATVVIRRVDQGVIGLA
ncbi:PhoX family protein [Streptomyces sp. NPDC059533]|uniref:PhoX family protein n=1 Tax=Streptomyces sp. NPDC059533 TaxID=3346858 RepID=UPI00368AF4CF